MLNEAQRTDKFCEYYAKWITVYKKGAIRQVTMDKYLMTQKWLEKLIPDLKICDLNRIAYQQLLNDYAEYHERQTTMDFHHQLKGAVLDAVDEGLIDRDPTRKAVIKGKAPSTKKIKYLNQFELHTLLASLELKDEVNWDYFILLVAKTGMRFSEALALTPKDFDFYHQTLSISKTWDYKGAGGFQPTKNKSSVRKIQIDWQSVIRFSELVKGLPDDQPIFVDGKVYNSTVNDVLSRHCERCNIPVISIHGLRHTHASLLLFTGVSIASVARRLGHSSMTTTQKTYAVIVTLVVLGDLMNIPKELNEAALIDGATGWQLIRYIQLPLCRASIGTSVIASLTSRIAMYEQIALTTSGGPGDDTMSLPIILVKGIMDYRYGYANAVGVVMFIIGLIVLGVVNKLFRMDEANY